MPYPGGVGGPAARSVPFPSRLRLESALSKYTRNLDTEIFRKNVGIFWGRSGVPPAVAPEGGLALLRVKPSLPQCSCVSESPRVRIVPEKKTSKAYSLFL